jgi:hypothetical protein
VTRRGRLLLIGLIAFGLLLLTGLIWRLTRHETSSTASAPAGPVAEGVVIVASSASENAGPGAQPLLGERILLGYGAANETVEHDLTLVSHLMENFLLLVKTAADKPLSANEDWAAELCGRNPAHERFLPEHHAILDAQRRLVDRWGTPLFFHALGGRRFEIRSAGPDKEMWTADDVQRNSDGTFEHGTAPTK